MGRVKDIFQDAIEKLSEICPDCDGDGIVMIETYKQQGFSRDVGEIYIDPQTCETCSGEGAVFKEENDD